LPGQELLWDRLEHLLARAGRHQQMAGVLVLQVEGLEAIRDTLGEEQFDRTLQSLAGYFRASLRGSDTIARVAENQFAFLLEEIVSASACQVIAERLAEFLPLIQVADKEFPLTIHLGGSIYPWDGDQTETLLQRASVALGRALQEDKICQLYTSRLEREP
jgi:diguanylate cyclase (GGDEF)-like protein